MSNLITIQRPYLDNVKLLAVLLSSACVLILFVAHPLQNGYSINIIWVMSKFSYLHRKKQEKEQTLNVISDVLTF